MTPNEMNAILELLGVVALDEFIAEVRNLCTTQEPSLGYFVPHDSSHFAGVERSVERLMAQQRVPEKEPLTDATRPPSPVEKLILQFCCWGHDVGMLREVSKRYHASGSAEGPREEWKTSWARKHHDEASSFFITSQFKKIADRILELYALPPDMKTLHSSAQDVARKDCQGHQQALVNKFKGSYPTELLHALIAFLESTENHNAVLAHLANLANTISLIASYHRRQKNIKLCPEQREVLGEVVRARFLAALFRLADALHVDRSRFSYGQFDAIRYQSDFSPESRRHWMKSYLVSSILLNQATHSLDVQLDLPDSLQDDHGNTPGRHSEASTRHQLAKRKNIIDGMRDFILNDLEEDLFSVSGILLEHSFPPLLRVTSKVHRVPAMVYAEDIWSVLDDLNAIASPNTSQLISSALASIKDIYAAPNLYKDPKESVKTRLGSLRESIERRPCHEGLKKIERFLRALIMVFTDPPYEGLPFDRTENHIEKSLRSYFVTPVVRTGIIDETEFLMVCLEGVHTTFREQRDLCVSVINEGKLDKQLEEFSESDNLLLYGYSEQVIEVVRRITNKFQRSPRIYVLECRTKSQYTPTGRLIYNDGVRFAESLREKLGRACKILLTPDSAMGRILGASRPGEKTLILLGSNAITLDGHLVHSMGHATVAATAKSPLYAEYTKVCVLTDGLKIGGTIEAVKRHENHQRNERQWLTHDSRAQALLNRNEIESINWQEDIVPRELISNMLIVDKGESIDVTTEAGRESIVGHEFLPYKDFNAKLHTRVVANRIRNNFSATDGEDDLFRAIVSTDLIMSANADEKPEKAQKPQNVDKLCFGLAEMALKGSLNETARSLVAHPKWPKLLDCALKAAVELKEPLAIFASKLVELYNTLRKEDDLSAPSPKPVAGVANTPNTPKTHKAKAAAAS